jgi:hypothetical protein
MRTVVPRNNHGHPAARPTPSFDLDPIRDLHYEITEPSAKRPSPPVN